MDEDGSTGGRLRRHRRRAGLTQEELAAKTGLGVRTIRGLESGTVRRPRASSVRLLAGAFGVPPEDLLPDTAGSGRARPAAEPAPAIGCQLPADVADFTARPEERARLAALLVGAGGAGVPVAVVHGRPGVGKSALAVHVAHAVRDRFPDGQLYVRLRGGDDPLDPAEVLGRFLRAVGADGPAIPPTADERAAEFRARLSDRRVLVVLDDASTEAQVRPLLPGTAGCAVLVTGRASLAGLLGAGRVALDVLDHEDSVELLGRIAGPDRVVAEREAADRIARACGGLPLALRIAAARSADTPLADLADALADEGGRLDELTAGDAAVRASFALGYRDLDPVARRAYRRLGLLRAQDVPAWAVEALLDTDGPTARAAAAQLVAARLVDPYGQGAWTHYRMHDLVRLDARERARAEDPAADRRAAVRRALDGWLHLAAAADRRLASDTMPLPDPVPPGWRPDPDVVGTLLAEPLVWFDTERVALLAAVRQSGAEAFELTPALVDSVIDFYATRYHPDDWTAAAEQLRESAAAAGDRRLVGHALRRLAEVQIFRRGDAAAAEALARAAVAECTAAGDTAGAGVARMQLGSMLRFTTRPVEAVRELERAHAELLAAGAPGATGHVDFEIGMALTSLNDRAAAREHFAAAADTLRQAGDLRGCANALTGLADTLTRDGRPAAGLIHARQALALLERIGDRRLAAVTRALVGQAEVEADGPQAALGTLRAALAEAQELRDTEAEGLSWCGLGEAHRRLGDLGQAGSDFAAARDRFRRAQMTYWIGRAEHGLGLVAVAEGDVDRGRRSLLRAAELVDRSEPARAERIRAELAALPG